MKISLPIFKEFYVYSNPLNACSYYKIRRSFDLSISKGGIAVPDEVFDCKREEEQSCQTHVHEYLGSTTIFEEIPHNHRFAGVTSEAIPSGNSHVHQLLGNSDFAVGHLHEVGARTGPAIPVGGGKHVHFVNGTTTLDRGHVHQFTFATLIEDPID
ncbi:YmaF family protein [Clostridium sp. MSJ-11]|uniref:YmaF family protein n=1 Tax=Clostridium mobile TaxID=2841512 RepID=A0ABS6EEV2_9CLOT|nr:YmaF family protein [Clostridium mobile]